MSSDEATGGTASSVHASDTSRQSCPSVSLSACAARHAVGVTLEDSGANALATRVRVALESADVSQFGELLDPRVRWGAPDDPSPSCQSRDEVLAWYGRGRAAGRHAHVIDVQAHGDKILVHLTVSTRSHSGAVIENDRWQVLTCARGRIVDIRGFETSAEAFARIAPRR